MTPEEKIEQLEKMRAADPENHLTCFLLGREYMKAERFHRAAERLEECCAHKPDYTAAYRHWGDSLRMAGRDPEAADVYRRGIAISEETGDLQTGKEMRALLKKVESGENPPLE